MQKENWPEVKRKMDNLKLVKDLQRRSVLDADGRINPNVTKEELKELDFFTMNLVTECKLSPDYAEKAKVLTRMITSSSMPSKSEGAFMAADSSMPLRHEGTYGVRREPMTNMKSASSMPMTNMKSASSMKFVPKVCTMYIEEETKWGDGSLKIPKKQ